MTPARLFILIMIFLVLMAPGLALLWLAILQGATFSAGIITICSILFFFGLVACGVMADDIS